jgi:hypothetical protein
MAKISAIDENSETFPLYPAYEYLISKGYGNDVVNIRESKDQYKKYKTTLRKAKIVNLLEKSELLNDFIELNWQNGNTEDGKKKLKRYRDVFNGFIDSIDKEIEETEETEDSSFADESDLRDYLANNLNVIESGLKLFTDIDGKSGVEYYIDSDKKRIDILAIDKEKNYVVIELKVNRGYEKVIGQALYYKSMVKEKFNSNNVRIIILAKEITKYLKKAVEDLPFVELYEYSLSVSVKKV